MADKVKKYILEGLDCANCAEKIRASAEQLDEISKAEMSFVRKELTVYHNEKHDGNKITEAIKRIVKQLEPDVEVYEKELYEEGEADHKSEIIQLIISGVLFAAGFALHLIYHPEPSLTWQFFTVLALFAASYLVSGLEVIITAVKNIAKGEVFDENFLMTIATIGAFAICEFPEGAAVMLFFRIGELFEGIAVNRSRKSITELMNLRPDYANLKTAAGIEKVSPEQVKIGDVITVKPGEKIPLDGIVLAGTSSLDTSALTGESVPRDVTVGTEVLSGSVNKNGLLDITVTKCFGESTASKILELVQNAESKKCKTEGFITRFAKIYTPIVVIAAVLIATIPVFFGQSFTDWLYRGLLFLVVSCPCALVISVPLSYFSGIGRASRAGILVKGSDTLEALTKVRTVVFDKTGTLTKGVFKVTEQRCANGFSKEKLLELAAYAESNSTHPIAVSVREAFGGKLDGLRISACEEIAGQGIRAVVDGKTVLAGNALLMSKNGIKCDAVTETNVQLAVDGKYAGCLIISDEVKKTSAEAIAEMKKRGFGKIVMLTGDNKSAAEKTAKQLGITEVYSQLLPQDKAEKLEALEAELGKNEKLIFTGDGINDAPVLARADVGISMGGLGSDSAIEAADAVLMNDEPAQIVTAIDIARYTRKIVLQNIVFALAVKLIVQILGVCGIATMWEAVFADVGVTVIAVLNSMRILRRK